MSAPKSTRERMGYVLYFANLFAMLLSALIWITSGKPFFHPSKWYLIGLTILFMILALWGAFLSEPKKVKRINISQTPQSPH